MAEAIFKADAIRKHSVLLDDSDSEGMDKSTEKLQKLNSPNLSTISSQRNQKGKDFKV